VHRGFLLAAGPGVAPGGRPEAHALDIPPTILALLGARIPAHFDGKPLPLTTDAPEMAAAG
jgi:arylsulfatase A-like enzyme